MRNVLFVFALLVLVLAPPAHANNPFDEVTQLDLWKVIEAGDIQGAERMFADAYAQGLRDPENRHHVRWLYEVFGTSSPEATSFAVKWAEDFPDSPFSHTALAWVYYRTGYDIRGEEFARETYIDALGAFYQWHQKAWWHAEKAYGLEPNLLPASDAILRLAKSAHRRLRAIIVLDEVMAQNPNMGTLLRGLDMTTQDWGSFQFLGEVICKIYGPLIKKEDGTNTTKLCLLHAAGFYHRTAKREWLLAEAQKREFPEIDYFYAGAIPTKIATREQAAFLYEYLS
ncbi:MAG: hypothetical protein AAFO72_04210, partial [Pseudomonadota bacterium]